MPSSCIHAVAVLGASHEPLVTYVVDDQQDIVYFDFLFQAACDGIDAKLEALACTHSSSSPSQSDFFLGCVASVGPYQVFVSVTNFKFRILLICSAETTAADARMVLSRLHESVVEAACNPFHSPLLTVDPTAAPPLAYPTFLTSVHKALSASRQASRPGGMFG